MYGEQLYFYEEILLLNLKDATGVPSIDYLEFSIAGAIIVELLMAKRITVGTSKKKIVSVCDHSPMGDPVIDECFDLIKSSKKFRPLNDWISKTSEIKKLFHKAARQLCIRNILKDDEKDVLFFFKKKVYPEINPIPEKKVISRLHSAIFTDSQNIDPRTVVLISLAQGARLLGSVFDKKELKQRKDRIDSIVKGDVMGKAVKEVIEALEAVIFLTVMMPTIITT